MPTGTLCLFDSTLDGLLRGTVPALDTSVLTGLLLAPSYVPNPAAHSVFADVSAHEFMPENPFRKQLTGTHVTAQSFHSDDIIFGDPVTLGPVRYLAFVIALSGVISPTTRLLGVADLSPAGGALEAQRGKFSVTAPPAGWFGLALV